MNRLGAVPLLFLSVVLLACQLEYILPTPAPSAAPRATRTKTPGAASTAAPLPTAAPQLPPGFLPGGSPLVLATAQENLRVRATPSTTAQVVDQLSKGDKAQVVGKNAAGDWLQILLPANPNARGWVLASFTDVSGPVESIPVVPAGGAPPPQPYPGQPPAPAPNPYP